MEQATRTRGRPRYDQEDAEAAEAFRSIGSKVKLNRDEAAPLWVQLRNQVEEAINTGLLAANSRIPSEQALCDFFGVSRPVVRAAIGSLSNEGRIIKMPRKGMFVAGPREHVDFMTANLGVFDDLTAKGHKVSTRTLEIYRCPPSEKESKVFGIPANGSVVRIS
ncbi:MAG: GntR family transcriptional regulator, partial [Mesorhizobium sp.]